MGFFLTVDPNAGTFLLALAGFGVVFLAFALGFDRLMRRLTR